MLIDTLVEIFGTDLPVFALLFVGLAVEKHYVSRVTVFTSTIALNIHLLSLTEIPQFMAWYGDLGLLLGLYGMAAYLFNAKTTILYNLPAYTLYSSLPVALVILSSPGGWFVVLILASLVSLGVGYYLEEELGIHVSHWGPRHGEVNRFIRTAQMKFVDAHGVHQKVDLALGEFNK